MPSPARPTRARFPFDRLGYRGFVVLREPEARKLLDDMDPEQAASSITTLRARALVRALAAQPALEVLQGILIARGEYGLDGCVSSAKVLVPAPFDDDTDVDDDETEDENEETSEKDDTEKKTRPDAGFDGISSLDALSSSRKDTTKPSKDVSSSKGKKRSKAEAIPPSEEGTPGTTSTTKDKTNDDKTRTKSGPKAKKQRR